MERVNSVQEYEEKLSRLLRLKAGAQPAGIGRILGEKSGPRGTKRTCARLRVRRMCLAAEHPSDEDLELYARERLNPAKPPACRSIWNLAPNAVTAWPIL